MLPRRAQREATCLAVIWPTAWRLARVKDKRRLTDELVPNNIAIVTAYNDMLRAHAPYERYPALMNTAEKVRVRWLKSQAVSPRCVMGSPKGKTWHGFVAVFARRD